MKFISSDLYHIYNRGNNRQQIFFKYENYLYFLGKVRKLILPNCDILSYCLLPNNFQFLISANSKTISHDEKGRNFLSEGFRHLLSSYAKGINVQEKRTGSLFTQNTHGDNVNIKSSQALECLMYIHQTPIKTKLVDKMEDWVFSSFKDYCGFRRGTICNKDLAFKLFDICTEDFYSLSYKILPEYHLKNFFELPIVPHF
ncbi:MAG: transposase [Ignavibacteria bacterium]